MNRNDFKSMSTDELWALHDEIAGRLAAALTAEKSVLENRLRRLQRGVETHDAKSPTARRPYPAVVPKYRNPERPSETWAGRGKTPRWLAEQLKSGRRIDDFRIRHAA
jgi:DNA-binding protein H-NS